jgi:integrase
MQVMRTNKGIFYREKVYIDGKAIHSPRFKRKTDASHWKSRMEVEKSKYKATGVLPKIFRQDEFPTLDEAANHWLNTRVKLQLCPRTYEHYQGTLRKHILPIFGNLRLNEIKIQHGHQLIERLLTKGHNAKGINLILGVWKRVLIEATREEVIDKNPFQYLREMKEAPTHNVFLSRDQISRIMEVCHGHYFQSAFLLAVNSGMRRGEIAGLCWDKVNFQTGLIEISRIRDRNGLEERTKTQKSRRFIPMNRVVFQHLEDLKHQLKHKDFPPELVIVDDQGEAFDVNHLYREFGRFLKLAGIQEHFRFHDLRHTFASHFMMNGGNIYDLQKILGHSSLEMTQRYAHLAPEHLITASNVVSFSSVKRGSRESHECHGPAKIG